MTKVLNSEVEELIFGAIFQFEGDVAGLKALNEQLEGSDNLVKALLEISETEPELVGSELWDLLIEKIYNIYDPTEEESVA